MNEKGFAPIALIIALIIVGLTAGGVYLLINNNKSNNLSQQPVATTSPSTKPQSVSSTTSPSNTNQDFSIDPLTNGPMLQACGKGLSEFPASAAANLRTSTYVDLGNNKLTSLPINQDWQKIKELNLVGNNFSVDQQNHIKRLLPNTKVAFVPQINFNTSVTENWKTYSNPKYHFTFNYHPDLQISEKDNEISVNNEFAFFESGYASCNSQDDFFGIRLTEKSNPQNLTPLQFINKDFGFKDNELTANGSPQSMISEIKPYKNNQINGVTFDAEESEHHIIYTSYGNYMYKFEIWPGGETGSSIGDIPKKVFYNILSTLKFN
jgi:hypothetical protein